MTDCLLGLNRLLYFGFSITNPWPRLSSSLMISMSFAYDIKLTYKWFSVWIVAFCFNTFSFFDTSYRFIVTSFVVFIFFNDGLISYYEHIEWLIFIPCDDESDEEMWLSESDSILLYVKSLFLTTSELNLWWLTLCWFEFVND